MSFVYADRVFNRSNIETVPLTGSVINTSYMRYDGRPGYWTRGWVQRDNASTIFALRLTASNVQNANNILVASWQLSCETDNNTVFKVLKNGSWQDNTFGTSSAYDSQNEWYWKGLISAYHDADNSSTMANYRLLYVGRAGTVGDVRLDIVMQDAGDSNRNLYINRTWNSGGQNGHETGVCTGVVFEIAQASGGAEF